MAKPLVMSIPHHLGRDEALRRLKSGLDGVRSNFGHLFTIQEETWTGNRLAFRLRVLGQVVGGTIEVLDDQAILEVVLPWLLARLAAKIQPLIRREGAFLLEKK